MNSWVKDNISSLAIIILVIILMLDRCDKGNTNSPSQARDTVTIIKEIVHEGTANTQPIIINQLPANQANIPKADTSYLGLLRQYQQLANSYYVANIYRDSTKIDTLGYVYTTDTVSNNELKGRSWNWNLKEKVITNTITVTNYPKPKRKAYIGIAVNGNQSSLVENFKIPILYQDKKDKLWSVAPTINTKANLGLEIGTYWKLHLGK